MPSRRAYIKAAGSAVAIGSIAGCSDILGEGGDEIRFGAINPLSGPAGFFGELASDIQTKWAEQVNDDGGLEVGGEQREIEISEYDSETSNEGVRSGLENAVNIDDVHMILSVFRTGGSLTAAPILREEEIPGITHGFTPRINEEGNYLLRFTTSTMMSAYPFLAYVSENDDIDTIGYMAEEGEFGDDSLEAVNWWFREDDRDGDYVELGRFPREQTDFSSFISEAQNADVDAVVVDTWATPLQLFIEQAGSRGLNEEMPIICGVVGGDWTPNIGELGSAMENVLQAQVYARPDWAENEVISETLPDDYQERVDQLNELDLETHHPVNYLFYSELLAVEEAFSRADSLEGSDLREAFLSEPLDTLVGELQLNDVGQGAMSVVLAEFGTEGDSPTVVDVPFSTDMPAITSIPPDVDL